MPPADHQSLCKCAGDSDASEESKGIIWELGLQGNVDGLVKFKLKMDWGGGKEDPSCCICSYFLLRLRLLLHRFALLPFFN